MSLINKMLQDLDARGGAQAAQGGVPQMRPVAAGGQRPRAAMAAGVGLAVVLLAASGWLGWRYLQRPPLNAAVDQSPPAAVNGMPPAGGNGMPATAVKGVPAAAGRAAGASAGADSAAGAANGPAEGAGSGRTVTGVAPLPTARLLAVARPIPVPPDAVQQQAAPADAGEATAGSARRPVRAQAEDKDAAQVAAELKAARKQAREAKAEAERLAARGNVAEAAAASVKAAAARTGEGSRDGASAREAAAARAAKAEARPARSADTAAQPGAGGVTVTSQQQGENAYRRGLAALQEGRVQEAIADMEQAVFLYPRHEAARQTLVGLLIENRRHDEAVRHLQFGLGLDPRQPQLAMILARLQIEKGGPAIETLQRTLPYAAGNADYLAFLAGALQRAQRNREAAEQYQAALRLQPQNGVWWMGLGISLLADKRNAEALDAFTRAKNSGNLSQELQSFVERKLQQLAR
jgi:MSHA biogenesis protein MshN